MPALLVDTTAGSASPSDASRSSERSDSKRSQSRSASPDRPPVSPITPTASHAQLATVEPAAEPRTRVAPPPPQPQPPQAAFTATFRPQPPSVPISESENPDAIALRSAISLLQMQREKSKRDLKALEDLKAAAVSDPEGFVRSLQAQREQASKSYTDVLTPTLSHLSDSASSEAGGAAADRNEREEEGGQTAGNARKDSAQVQDGAPVPEPNRFPPIPQPQNVIRCPPVNWAKYHIVGEPLDKMHEEQRQYPGSVEPPRTHQGSKAPPHAVASPYSPFTDGVGESQPTPQWRQFKKSPS
ncbi:hypothetical protein BS50DRAFT_199222 [Corynespora cassiicola Philippines]|uniref:Uncharacterized protein n=1 Tax=Corynespora cassiicola Philippines TaxID=1448308 RepID=A0A2T2N6H9_CORCC|nr:hypothetical protein BS50DRAFT_199222 [Corynespora cassiicola Philippines]